MTRSVVSTQPRNTGKRYLEILLVGGSGQLGITRDNPPDDVSEVSTNGMAYDTSTGQLIHEGAVVLTGAMLDAGDVVGIAVDFSSLKVWFSVNGVFLAGGDPAAGTGEQATVDGGLYFAGAGTGNANPLTVTLRTAMTQFAVPPPSGFVPFA